MLCSPFSDKTKTQVISYVTSNGLQASLMILDFTLIPSPPRESEQKNRDRGAVFKDSIRQKHQGEGKGGRGGKTKVQLDGISF